MEISKTKSGEDLGNAGFGICGSGRGREGTLGATDKSGIPPDERA